jgi:predicted flap endonuclease-1-like 5' DNA nuclease
MEDMMWADFFKRWLDLCFWWLPKTKGEGKSSANKDRTHTMAENAATDLKASERGAGEEPRGADTDDLTVIKGIGSATQRKLSTFGIKTLADLAASDPEKLLAKLGASQPISAARVKRWIKEAQDRTAGRT